MKKFVLDKDNYYFIAFDSDFRGEYEKFQPLVSLLPKNLTGTTTGFDALLIDFDRENLFAKLEKFADPRVSDATIRSEFSATKGHAARVLSERYQICQGDWKKFVKPFQLFPFDFRSAFLKQSVLQGHRFDVMQNLAIGKPGLLAMRQTKEQFGVFVANGFCGHKLLGSYDRNYVFPLHDLLFEGQYFLDLRAMHSVLLLMGHVDLPTEVDAFNYAYAVFHSPTYRNRYSEFLKLDFPRVPLPESRELFQELAKLGAELVSLHLLVPPKIVLPLSEFIGQASSEIERITWSNDTVWIDRAQTVGFRGVPEAVWFFRIGSYQVCEKWLKERQGRMLSISDIDHYQSVIIALTETIRLMSEVDMVVNAAGGFPRAFSTVSATANLN